MTKSKRNHRNTPNSRYLRIHQVLEIFPIGMSTWWKWVAEGKAPRGIKLGPKTTVWLYQDILDLMESFEEAEDEM